MRTPTTAEMIRKLERLATDGELTAEESATLAPIAEVMHSGVVTKLTDEQVEALDAMYSQHFRKR
ncbi:hypothetical protein [Pandoraea apista]|uniref:hypothetical protein n=1 Tax=Pandoraea apista TaxID=93218 RepID=UPI000F66356D|nr:hypothetical protein [Pandoraea apista]RRW90624.1 hypothetical protein EGJ54_21985 [Pandoraea apista]RRX00416.1 hypothetical protein EGJ56_19230 [Pandoraea apista]